MPERCEALLAGLRRLVVGGVLTGGLLAAPAGAQSVVDGSDARVEQARVAVLLTLIGESLRRPDARVTALRPGRQGALCGAVEVRNRMGAYTGSRPFVFDPDTGVFGRLPEGPELRNPASPADYAVMERVTRLFAQNCAGW